MESLESVLERRKGDLVEVLVSGTGLSAPKAERFVDVAGHDLVESLLWCNGSIRRDRLCDPGNVRNVLGHMGAGRIASHVGMRRTEVWAALRTFVPRALELADRCLDT